jgi:hypothetical protein
MQRNQAELSYVHPSLRDINNQPVTIRCKTGYQGYGTHPWGLVRSTAGGRRHYVVIWMPNQNTARFTRKADTTTWINAHRDLQHSGIIPSYR